MKLWKALRAHGAAGGRVAGQMDRPPATELSPGRPVGPGLRPLVYVVAGTYRSARIFVQWTQEDPRTFKIVTQPEQLRGLALEPEVIFLDGGWHHRVQERQMMIDYLTILRARVRYTNLDYLTFGGSRDDHPGP